MAQHIVVGHRGAMPVNHFAPGLAGQLRGVRPAYNRAQQSPRVAER